VIDLSNIRLIVFDVDGTLTKTKSGATFRKTADDWEPIDGRIAKLRDLREQAFSLALASNQGGVAFGYMEEADIQRELQRTAKWFYIPEQAVFACYTHPKASIDRYRTVDDRRKPGADMLIEAMQAYHVSAAETLMVGDRPEDEEAAKNAGCAFIWAHEFFEEEK
jgi:D-glycero-D-manno-heptose 1,7-bisphosphate phosphatase